MGDVVLDVKVGGVVHSSTQSCNTVVINFIILLRIIWFVWIIVIILWSYITIFLDRMKKLYTALQVCCCCTESRDWLGTMVFLRDVI